MTPTNSTLSAGLFLFSYALAAPALGQADLQRCAGIADDSARLQCYDELAVPSAASFGLEQKRAPVPEATVEAVDEVMTKVTAARHTDLTGWTFTFDNGQTWKQIGTERFEVEVGETCVISRGLLKSFRLKCGDRNRNIRLTRME